MKESDGKIFGDSSNSILYLGFDSETMKIWRVCMRVMGKIFSDSNNSVLY